MHLIEQQPHFWELYQDDSNYYLSIAIDMSSVVSCWDIKLTENEIKRFQSQGRVAIEEIAGLIVRKTYRGDFSTLESRKVSADIEQQIQMTFKVWRSTQ